MHVSEQSKSLPPIQPPPHCPKNCSSVASLHRHRDSLQEEFSAAGLSGGFAEASCEVSRLSSLQSFHRNETLTLYCCLLYVAVHRSIGDYSINHLHRYITRTPTRRKRRRKLNINHTHNYKQTQQWEITNYTEHSSPLTHLRPACPAHL